jgi:hypothetical protein
VYVDRVPVKATGIQDLHMNMTRFVSLHPTSPPSTSSSSSSSAPSPSSSNKKNYTAPIQNVCLFEKEINYIII